MQVTRTPMQQFAQKMTGAIQVTRTAASEAHVIDDYVSARAHQAHSAVAQARRAAEMVNSVVGIVEGADLYDATSFANYAIEQLEAGIAALAPYANVEPFDRGAGDLRTSLATAERHFLNADGWIRESLDAI